MKYILIISLFAVLASCHSNIDSDSELTQEDTTVSHPKQEIARVLDSMHQAFKIHDYAAMESYLTEEGLFLGTDPNEIWSKKQLTDYFNGHVKDTIPLSYSINNRIILLGRRSKAALVIEQYYLNRMSEKIMVRSISRLVYEAGGWKINFYSWNMIPKNEDIQKLNNALINNPGQ